MPGVPPPADGTDLVYVAPSVPSRSRTWPAVRRCRLPHSLFDGSPESEKRFGDRVWPEFCAGVVDGVAWSTTQATLTPILVKATAWVHRHEQNILKRRAAQTDHLTGESEDLEATQSIDPGSGIRPSPRDSRWGW